MPAARRRVPFVGLTGGIAAGKSEALRLLGELGAATLSTDAVVSELLQEPQVRDAIVERLGSDVAPGGRLDRSLVAERAFGNDDSRQWLEGLLWPRVGERVAAWKEAQDAADPSPLAAVVEVPLLFEAGMEGGFDVTLAVVAEEPLRERRAGARGHAALAARTGRQLTQEEKARRADVVIENDGSLGELREALSRALATIGGRERGPRP
jgi:dephospho-CoA kinase